MNKSDGVKNRPFKNLGEYEWPSMPAERSILSFYNRARILLKIDDGEPVMNDEQLHRATIKRRDDITTMSACGPLVKETEAEIAKWTQSGESRPSILLLVLPPCQRKNLLEDWAEANNKEILHAPARVTLLEAADESIDVNGEDVLVIADLADWYLRHQNGLVAIKLLLSALYDTDRPCIVGCNSWAWQFLNRAVNADHYLPEPMMFQAFDGYRLRQWFIEMAEDSGESDLQFLESRTGEDVLKVKDDDTLECEYLNTLAAHSLGIPWVAWQVWRRSLRTVPDDDTDSEKDPDDEKASGKKAPSSSAQANDGGDTMWVVAAREYTLTEKNRNLALLIMHALLLHGALSQQELESVVPMEDVSASVQALIRQGFVNKTDGVLWCSTAAYPAARQYLANSGFPTDTL